MSITDELRESMDPCISDDWLTIEKSVFEIIADRIDAEHAKAVERARMDGMDETFGNGWVKLPVDADGVPIHVGDVMDVGIVFAIGDEGVFMVENGFSGKYDVECFDGFACHHVKPDSWVRIIGDAMSFEGDGWYSTRDDAMAELVERCRRLAGEDA